MPCGKLTLPQIVLLAAYVVLVGGFDELGLGDKPLIILAIALTVAATLAVIGRSCTLHSEGR